MDDKRASEGVEHLQTAALELIDAARAFLDVAEHLVHDKARVADVVAAVSSVAEGGADLWTKHKPRTWPAGSGATAGGEGSGRADHPPRRSRVQHIDVQ